jgi:transcriptional regulator with XRE-family HTH domain
MQDHKKTIEAIGAFIKHRRHQYGYTGDFLAEKLNMSRQTLCNIENGHHSTATLITVRVLDFLGADFSDLQDWIERYRVDRAIEEKLKNKSAEEKKNLLKALDAPVKKAAKRA